VSPLRTAPSEVEILIVEDSLTQAEQLRALLEGHGYRVGRAADGEEAIEMASRKPPALIISDIVMPKMDGYALCKALKANPLLQDVPIVLVTTLSDSQDVIRGLECGADNFIRKPYEERYLLSRLDYLLMNLVLRKDQRMQMGVEINLGGKRHFITAERQQILDLLISTYEQAVDLNSELTARQMELAQANRVLEGLYGLGQGLNQATNVAAVAETTLNRLKRLPGIDGGWVSLGGKGSDHAVLASRDLPADFDLASAAEDDAEWLQTLPTDNEAGGGVETIPSSSSAGRLHRVRLPLSSGGRTLGVMNLIRLDDEIDEATLRVLPGVGNQVSVALERARLHERLEQLVEERTSELQTEISERMRQEVRVMRLNRLYSVLSGINNTIVHVHERDELFRESCRIAVENGGFCFAWIGLLDEASGRPRAVARAGGDDNYQSLIDLAAADEVPTPADLVGRALRDARPVICNDIAADAQLAPWSQRALSLGCRSTVVLPLLQDGKPLATFTLYATETDLFDEDEMRLLTEISADVSFALEHIRKSERLHELAFFDDVTKLPNRAFALEQLRIGLQGSADSNRVGIALLDLDRFKTINDSLGHDVGDEFLRAVGDRLKHAVGPESLVARVAGDEFALLIDHIASPAHAVKVAEAALACLEAPLDVRSYELFTGASVGIALHPADGESAEELLKKADVAMYRAKAEGGGTYRFYTPSMGSEADERLALETAFRQGLESDEFLLHYQPVFDLTSQRLIGLEALVRWQRAQPGLVYPDEFIPLAEETGLIVQLGNRVLQKACEQGKRWSEQSDSPPRIKVNISPRQFREPDLFQNIKRILEVSGLDPRLLTLEITESHLMHNAEATSLVMAKLSELGVQFSIDDFGTGYSSFSYLSQLQIDSLKIDRSFIRNLPARSHEAAIVTAMISMAHSLGMQVIAEGVETAEQLEFLRTQGCDAVQGYYTGRPAPAAEIARLLKDDPSFPKRN
jgi:diguanylate cyclase (GGDEF)-like protein